MAGGGASITLDTPPTNDSPTAVTVTGTAFGNLYPNQLVTLYYGLTSGSTTYSIDYTTVAGNGPFSIPVTGLTAGTLYYMYGRGWDGNTFSFSSSISFTTLSATSVKAGALVFFA